MRYEVVVYGSTAVIGREGDQVKGDPPQGAIFYSPDGERVSAPPLPFRRFHTLQEAEAWAREHAIEVCCADGE